MSSRATVLQTGISWILRAGVALSLALMSVGILLKYLQTGNSSLGLSSAWLAGGGNFFGFVASTAASLVAGASPVSITALGVAVLMLTPYARVLAAVFYYTLDRNWKYVGMTLFVLAVITFGLAVF